MQDNGVKGSVCKYESPNYTDQQEQIMSHNIPYFHFSCYFMAVRVLINSRYAGIIWLRYSLDRMQLPD